MLGRESRCGRAKFAFRPLKFIEAKGGRANDKPIFVDKNGHGFETGTFRRVQKIAGSAVAVLIEMKEQVVETHPDVAVVAVDADSGQDPLEYRCAALLLQASDLAAHGLGFRKGI